MRSSMVPFLVLGFIVVLAGGVTAATPGQAHGTVTLDGAPATLAYASSASAENLFDDKKQDTIIVLSDRPLDDLSPADDVGLHIRAREGKLVALALRLDGAKLVNVAVHGAGLDGVALLPGAWFTYQRAGAAAGSLKLAKREFDGHNFSCAVEFAASAWKATAKPVVAEPAEAAPEPTPTLPPASTSTIDPKAMTALLVAAMMSKDEDQALRLVQSGADPNARDQYGVPVLNWAVMVCMPRLVKALVAKGADLKYERAPGLTIMQEAGACPEAAKILRAAGAK